MTPDPFKFDEPVLKSAVRRVWGRETAPPELRAAVERRLETEGAVPDVIRVEPSVWRRKARWVFAAAAAVALAASVVAVQMSRQGQGGAGGTIAVATLPADLGGKLVHRHVECGSLHAHDHHLFTDAAKDDYPAIAKGMSAKLNHPVIAPPMGDGWDFWGAAVCPVGRQDSAHLVYAKGDALVSVFSLPASVCPSCPDHNNCDASVDGHPIAGFVEGGAFYCVVASPGTKAPLDLPQIRALRDRLRTEVAAGHVGPDLVWLASAGL